MRLYLIGYMGCGKSSIGRKVAKALGWEFADTDTMVEGEVGEKIADFMSQYGEEEFRKVEAEMLQCTGRMENTVVAVGGGTPVYGDNMECIRRMGKSVYLKRTPEQICSRLSPHGKAKRPLLRGKSDEEIVLFMREHMASREQTYSKCDITVDCTALCDEEILERIVNFVTD